MEHKEIQEHLDRTEHLGKLVHQARMELTDKMARMEYQA